MMIRIRICGMRFVFLADKHDAVNIYKKLAFGEHFYADRILYFSPGG